jgi:predicted ferric reductase
VILLTSPYFIRGRVFESFLVTHKLLALVAVGGTLWHIFSGEFIKLLFPIISLSVWSMTTVYRFVRNSRNRGYISSHATFAQRGRGYSRCAMELNVRLPGHVNAGPGAYVYLSFSWLPWRYRYQAHPLMVVCCEHEVEERDGKEHDATILTFLAQPQKGLTARLYRELQVEGPPVRKLVSFDGPYGQDLHLERYEMVMLVAKGIGIVGVLPYARYLADRQRHDGDIRKKLRLASTLNKPKLRNSLYRDATRKVDILWILEFNRQEEWISEQLRTLQDLDPHRVSRPHSGGWS